MQDLVKVPHVVVLGPSLPNYARTKNFIAAWRSFAEVTLIPTFPPDKPYRLSFLKSLAHVLWQTLTLRLPPDTTDVVVLFPDNENVLLAALHRWLYRKNYRIIFDAFISLYDTYVYNKPLPLIRRPQPLLTSLLKKWLYWYEKQLFSLPDLLLSDTTHHRDYLTTLFNLANRFEPVLLAADEDIFRPSQQENPAFWQTQPLRVIWYGHLSDMHGIEYILTALNRLSQENVVCTIIGYLRERTRGFESLITTGTLIYREVKPPQYVPLHSIADELTQHHVSLGIFGTTAKAQNVIANKEVEALASARCLVTQNAAREYLRHDHNCVMVNQRDPSDLARALLTLHRDRHYLQKIARQGRAAYERYASVDHLRDSLQKILI